MVMAGQVPQVGAQATGTPSQLAGLGEYFGQNLLLGQGAAGSDRLDVISGQQISEKGRATYEIDYRLRDRWWLIGEYDQFDDYNAGIKWRIYSAGGPHAAK
jgi:translocation and assembly module TamB